MHGFLVVCFGLILAAAQPVARSGEPELIGHRITLIDRTQSMLDPAGNQYPGKNRWDMLKETFGELREKDPEGKDEYYVFDYKVNNTPIDIEMNGDVPDFRIGEFLVTPNEIGTNLTAAIEFLLARKAENPNVIGRIITDGDHTIPSQPLSSLLGKYHQDMRDNPVQIWYVPGVEPTDEWSPLHHLVRPVTMREYSEFIQKEEPPPPPPPPPANRIVCTLVGAPQFYVHRRVMLESSGALVATSSDLVGLDSMNADALQNKALDFDVSAESEAIPMIQVRVGDAGTNDITLAGSKIPYKDIGISLNLGGQTRYQPGSHETRIVFRETSGHLADNARILRSSRDGRIVFLESTITGAFETPTRWVGTVHSDRGATANMESIGATVVHNPSNLPLVMRRETTRENLPWRQSASFHLEQETEILAIELRPGRNQSLTAGRHETIVEFRGRSLWQESGKPNVWRERIVWSIPEPELAVSLTPEDGVAGPLPLEKNPGKVGAIHLVPVASGIDTQSTATISIDPRQDVLALRLPGELHSTKSITVPLVRATDVDIVADRVPPKGETSARIMVKSDLLPAQDGAERDFVFSLIVGGTSEMQWHPEADYEKTLAAYDTARGSGGYQPEQEPGKLGELAFVHDDIARSANYRFTVAVDPTSTHPSARLTQDGKNFHTSLSFNSGDADNRAEVYAGKAGWDAPDPEFQLQVSGLPTLMQNDHESAHLALSVPVSGTTLFFMNENQPEEGVEQIPEITFGQEAILGETLTIRASGAKSPVTLRFSHKADAGDMAHRVYAIVDGTHHPFAKDGRLEIELPESNERNISFGILPISHIEKREGAPALAGSITLEDAVSSVSGVRIAKRSDPIRYATDYVAIPALSLMRSEQSLERLNFGHMLPGNRKRVPGIEWRWIPPEASMTPEGKKAVADYYDLAKKELRIDVNMYGCDLQFDPVMRSGQLLPDSGGDSLPTILRPSEGDPLPDRLVFDVQAFLMPNVSRPLWGERVYFGDVRLLLVDPAAEEEDDSALDGDKDGAREREIGRFDVSLRVPGRKGLVIAIAVLLLAAAALFLVYVRRQQHGGRRNG